MSTVGNITGRSESEPIMTPIRGCLWAYENINTSVVIKRRINDR